MLPGLAWGLIGCSGHAGSAPVEVVPLQPANERVARIGAYRLDAAWTLRRGDPRLGGLSGLIVRDGRLFAVSDRGTLVSARLLQTETGKIEGFADWSFTDLPLPGRAPDVEDLDGSPATGWLVPVENPVGIVAIAPDGAVRQLPQPPGMTGAPRNQVVEALTSLEDGSLLALSEGLAAGPGTMRGWLIRADRTIPIRWAVADGFVPVGADRDGDQLYVLERAVSLLGGGFQSRIRVVDLARVDWAPETVLDGEERARIDIEPYRENHEGIALERAGGRLWIWLVSDDNFSPLQSTRLLRLEVVAR
jgi:hypothetical protein